MEPRNLTSEKSFENYQILIPTLMPGSFECDHFGRVSHAQLPSDLSGEHMSYKIRGANC